MGNIAGKSKKIGTLDWRMRLHIACDAAQGKFVVVNGHAPWPAHVDVVEIPCKVSICRLRTPSQDARNFLYM